MKRIFNTVDKQWKRLPWQILLLAFAVPFLLRNLLMPMAGDDFSYAFIWDGEHWGNLMDGIGERERIDSFHDIIASQWSHYFTWGGRTPSMLCIQFFAWVGKVWFDVANALVFVLLMLVLYWLAVGSVVSPARHKGVFAWVMVCMLFGVLDYPSTMLWMTGACVYLWTGLWECAFLLMISRAPRLGLLLPLALLAGWSEEAGSLVTVVLTACLLFIRWRQKRLERWMVVAFGALLVGFALVMFAPGSIRREELMLQLAPEYVLPADKLFSAEMFLDNFTGGFLPILVWEAFLFLPILAWWRKHRRPCAVVPLFTAAGMLVLCAMMFAPEFAPRTGFHSTMFLTVASAAALKETGPWMKQTVAAGGVAAKAAAATGAAAAAYALVVMAGCFYVETSYRKQYDDRLEYVSRHREADSLVVKAFYIPHEVDRWLGPRSLTDMHLIYGADLEWKPTDNRSLMYARYYRLPPIRIDRKVDWEVKSND